MSPSDWPPWVEIAVYATVAGLIGLALFVFIGV